MLKREHTLSPEIPGDIKDITTIIITILVEENTSMKTIRNKQQTYSKPHDIYDSKKN